MTVTFFGDRPIGSIRAGRTTRLPWLWVLPRRISRRRSCDRQVEDERACPGVEDARAILDRPSKNAEAVVDKEAPEVGIKRPDAIATSICCLSPTRNQIPDDRRRRVCAGVARRKALQAFSAAGATMANAAGPYIRVMTDKIQSEHKGPLSGASRVNRRWPGLVEL